MWVVVEPALDGIVPRLHGVMLNVFDVLPDASANTLTSIYSTANAGRVASQGSIGGLIDPALAFLAAGLYAAVFLVIPALITRHSDIA